MAPYTVISPQYQLNSIKQFLPLSSIKRQTIIIGLERDLGTSWEVKHVALRCFDLLASLVADVEVAFENDLHFVVMVFVDERGACIITFISTHQ